VFGTSGVHFNLVEVLLLSSLCYSLLGIKVSTDLDQGHLKDPGFLLPHDEGLLPLHQLLYPCKKLLLKLFHHH
jgi:hypothetical protein